MNHFTNSLRFMTTVFDILWDCFVLINTFFIRVYSILDHPGCSDWPIWWPCPWLYPKLFSLNFFKIIIHIVNRWNTLKFGFQKVTVQILDIFVTGGMNRFAMKEGSIHSFLFCVENYCHWDNISQKEKLLKFFGKNIHTNLSYLCLSE